MENMASDNAGEFSKNLLGSFSDEAIKTMAEFSKIPEDQFPIFRAMMKGESNTFNDELEKVKPSKAGDLLLMTGNHPIVSRAIKAGYKITHPMYQNAISTHIAVIHADFICIDAIGGVGVSNRLITEVLTDVEDNWRVIRLKRELSDDELEKIADACAFYLAQPYKITPNKVQEDIVSKGWVMYKDSTSRAISINEASANDPEVQSIVNKITSGKVIASAPCDAMYNYAWTDSEVEQLDSVLDKIFA